AATEGVADAALERAGLRRDDANARLAVQVSVSQDAVGYAPAWGAPPWVNLGSGGGSGGGGWGGGGGGSGFGFPAGGAAPAASTCLQGPRLPLYLIQKGQVHLDRSLSSRTKCSWSSLCTSSRSPRGRTAPASSSARAATRRG